MRIKGHERVDKDESEDDWFRIVLELLILQRLTVNTRVYQ